MVSRHVITRLEDEIGQTLSTSRSGGGFWVNGCRRTQSLTRMDLSAPMVMFPIVGSKTIRVDQQVYAADPGEVLVLPKSLRFDMENHPTPERNRFLGGSVVFDDQTIALFYKLYGDGMADWTRTPHWKAIASDEVFSLIADWLAHDRSYATDRMRTRHRLAEILLLLARQGVAGNLLQARQDTLRDQIQRQFLSDLSRDWTIADLTQTLAMSESTLRRRLRAEQTQFRSLLEDTRLNRGVELVLASDMPIGQVAFACGYQSQSRFAERFRMRFSTSPTALRATQKHAQGDVVALDAHRRRV